MTKSMNRVFLMGNVGKDPEIRTMQDGTLIANFSLATTESWKDKVTGEKKEATEWHNVSVFNPTEVAKIQQNLKKGDNVKIEGQIKTRKWTDKQGQQKTITEIVISKFHGDVSWMMPPSKQTNNYNSLLQDDDLPF